MGHGCRKVRMSHVYYSRPKVNNSKAAMIGTRNDARIEGGGGLIRSLNGDWISGYARNIKSTSSVLVELWTFRDGLALALSLGLSHLIVELDAQILVSFLNSSIEVHPLLLTLVDDCRSLLLRIPNSTFHHVYREANKSVDALARL
ncbi:hypothetical protein SO802_029208 [Lithocarpus litseifolius]|uniref:RNase H type-1 domain-containing protein n=1 Tax=Lithocarpus litseifolius TaxID=425828 RepID=A0AAW2BVZ4_9ROSI